MKLRGLLAAALLLAPAVVALPALALQHQNKRALQQSSKPVADHPASPDDTAKFLAGLPVSSGSPLAPLADGAGWKAHAAFFDKTFKALDDQQISKVRAWSKANVTSHEATLFYFFSGPDFLYANAFFPDEKTYVLAGLEAPGSVPDMTSISAGATTVALKSLEASTRTLLENSFFVTRNMMSDLHRSKASGTLPVIYMFMARSGKVLKDVSLIQLNENGDAEPMTGRAKPHYPTGAKITFSSPGGPEQTLYYFGANLADGSFYANGFGKFCDKLGKGNALVKSASYVMHDHTFTESRTFLLDHTTSIVQDDTGVPVAMFDKTWQLHPFGVYMKPIPVFHYRFQPKMAALFSKEKPGPLDFRIGYRYRPNQSGLLYAVKQAPAIAHSDDKGAAKPAPAATTPAAAAPTASTASPEPKPATPSEPSKPTEAAKPTPPTEAAKPAPSSDVTGSTPKP